jgi:hypothetical protein
LFACPVIQAASGPPKMAIRTSRKITLAANIAALSSRNRSQKRRVALRDSVKSPPAVPLGRRMSVAAVIGF